MNFTCSSHNRYGKNKIPKNRDKEETHAIVKIPSYQCHALFSAHQKQCYKKGSRRQLTFKRHINHITCLLFCFLESLSLFYVPQLKHKAKPYALLFEPVFASKGRP